MQAPEQNRKPTSVEVAVESADTPGVRVTSTRTGPFVLDDPDCPIKPDTDLTATTHARPHQPGERVTPSVAALREMADIVTVYDPCAKRKFAGCAHYIVEAVCNGEAFLRKVTADAPPLSPPADKADLSPPADDRTEAAEADRQAGLAAEWAAEAECEAASDNPAAAQRLAARAAEARAEAQALRSAEATPETEPPPEPDCPTRRRLVRNTHSFAQGKPKRGYIVESQADAAALHKLANKQRAAPMGLPGITDASQIELPEGMSPPFRVILENLDGRQDAYEWANGGYVQIPLPEDPPRADIPRLDEMVSHSQDNRRTLDRICDLLAEGRDDDRLDEVLALIKYGSSQYVGQAQRETERRRSEAGRKAEETGQESGAAPAPDPPAIKFVDGSGNLRRFIQNREGRYVEMTPSRPGGPRIPR